MKRVALMYFFWMVIYSFFWLRVPELTSSVLAKLAVNIIFGYYHLWYLAGMLGAGILMVATKNRNPYFISALILMTFFAGVAIQYAGNYHVFYGTVFDKIFNSNWVHRGFVFFSFPFFCIGFLINRFSLHKKISFFVLSVVVLLGFSLLFAESYFNYGDPQREGGFDNYASLLIVCPSLFVLVQNLHFQTDGKLISMYSSGVYFVHIWVLWLVDKIFDFNGTTLTLVVIAASIVMSKFLIKLKERFPVIL